MVLERICVTPKENTHLQGGTKMNDKTMNQINEMKKQTIGVEVEMNGITRNRAAKIAADYFCPGIV